MRIFEFSILAAQMRGLYALLKVNKKVQIGRDRVGKVIYPPNKWRNPNPFEIPLLEPIEFMELMSNYAAPCLVQFMPDWPVNLCTVHVWKFPNLWWDWAWIDLPVSQIGLHAWPGVWIAMLHAWLVWNSWHPKPKKVRDSKSRVLSGSMYLPCSVVLSCSWTCKFFWVWFFSIGEKQKMQSHQDAEVLAGLQIMTMGAMHAFKRKKSKHEGGKSDGCR